MKHTFGPSKPGSHEFLDLNLINLDEPYSKRLRTNYTLLLKILEKDIATRENWTIEHLNEHVLPAFTDGCKLAFGVNITPDVHDWKIAFAENRQMLNRAFGDELTLLFNKTLGLDDRTGMRQIHWGNVRFF